MFNIAPQILIPDTIIYQFNELIGWYFTGKQGTVKKKSKNKSISEAVYESFTKNIPECQIVACIMRQPKMLIQSNNKEEDYIVYEYLNQEELSLAYFTCTKLI